MRQFSEDKGQLTSFHNLQKVRIKDSECISSQPAMNFFYLKSFASYFSLCICFCSSIHLDCSVLLDVYNVCVACSLWSYRSCSYFSIWDKSFTSFRLVLNLVPSLKRLFPKTNLSFWNLHVHYLFRRCMCVDWILLGPLQGPLFCQWWFHRANSQLQFLFTPGRGTLWLHKWIFSPDLLTFPVNSHHNIELQIFLPPPPKFWD